MTISGHLPRLKVSKSCATEVEGCTSWYGRISPWFTGGSPTCKGPLALGFLNHHMGPGPLVLLEDHHWWSIEKSDFSAGHLGECLYHGICFKHTGAKQRKENWWIFSRLPAVDRRNPAPVEVGSLSYSLRGCLHPKWRRTSSIRMSWGSKLDVTRTSAFFIRLGVFKDIAPWFIGRWPDTKSTRPQNLRVFVAWKESSTYPAAFRNPHNM